MSQRHGLTILRQAVAACLVMAGIAWSDDGPPVPATGQPSVPVRIRAAIERHGTVPDLPLPQLSQEDMGKLIEGKIVRLREKWVLPPRNEEIDPERKGRQLDDDGS